MNNLFSFSGRAGRAEYWKFSIVFTVLIMIAALLMDPWHLLMIHFLNALGSNLGLFDDNAAVSCCCASLARSEQI